MINKPPPVNLITVNKTHRHIIATSQNFAASVASIATPIGCFASGPICDKFGRKASLMSVNVVTFLGWAIITLAYQIPEHQYSIILAGRLLTGMSTGLASMPSSVYMAEVSSPKLRGIFTTASAVFFSLGVLVVYFLGYMFKVGSSVVLCCV